MTSGEEIDMSCSLDKLSDKIKKQKENGLKAKFFKNDASSKKRKLDTNSNNNEENGEGTGDAKPDWKKLKLEKKELKEKRKKSKVTNELYHLSKEAKSNWEVLKQESCDPEKRKELVEKTYKLIQPHTRKMVNAHDSVRVIESLVAFGSQKIRESIFEDLKADILTIMKSKYGHFLLLKFLKCGNKLQRNFVLESIRGNVVPLVRHQYASTVVDALFQQHLNAKEKQIVLKEFYGREYRVFKEKEVQSLQQALEKHRNSKTAILKDLRELLLAWSSKGLWNIHILHSILYEYLKNESDDEFWKEVMDSVRDHLIHILHTRDGAKVSMLCLWNSTSKERKAIIKSFKTHVTKICCDEHGYMVILAALDCIDDTVLMKKALLFELLSNIQDVMFNESGRKVISYLVDPRNPKHLHPSVISLLEEGDNNIHSKKDMKVRRQEILQSIQQELVGAVESNLSSWLKNNAVCLTISCIMTSVTEIPLETVYASLVDFLVSEPTESGLERPAISIILKSLIQNGSTKRNDEKKFATVLLDKLDDTTVKKWLTTNRGCFVFVFLLETSIPDIVDRTKRMLHPCSTNLKLEKFPGAKIILTCLDK